MRFQLEEHYGRQGFTRVAAPDLRGWRKSRNGVKSYSYSQGVTGLLAGESYRAQVLFRWLDSDGKTILQVRRHSGVCDQPGQGHGRPLGHRAREHRERQLAGRRLSAARLSRAAFAPIASST